MARQPLRIGGVADLAGVNVQTLRYYERRGLLRKPSRTPAGYRQYAPEAVRVVRFIRRAQSLGFTLSEIAELLQLREQRPRDRARVRATAEAKLLDIERKIRRLQGMRRVLADLIEFCACRRTELTCPILEALEEGAERPEHRSHAPPRPCR